jgi:hypothetical protein
MVGTNPMGPLPRHFAEQTAHVGDAFDVLQGLSTV